MIYKLKDCRTGGEAIYETTVEILEKDGVLTFNFTAKSCQYFCPGDGYNAIHSRGDALEILIGSDPKRELYYEIELSPKNELMIARQVYGGENKEKNNAPILDMTLLDDCFVKSEVTLTEDGYNATLSFKKEKILWVTVKSSSTHTDSKQTAESGQSTSSHSTPL